jgi:hypothetical protein
VLKTEFDPFVYCAPPPPTVTGNPVAVTGTLVEAFKGEFDPGAVDLNLKPPAPPPPEAYPLKSPDLPEAPLPATTKYSTLFDPAELPTLETQKVPSAVNI